MRNLAFIVFASIVLALTLSDQANAAEWRWSIHSLVGTNHYFFHVSESELVRTPSWKEGESNPPLSARTAVSIAKAFLTEHIAKAKDWRLDTVTLRRGPDSEHWFYVVVFTGPPPPEVDSLGRPVGKPEEMRIAVLMSGATARSEVKSWDKEI